QLSAKIDLPLKKNPFPFVIFAHVFTGNKNLIASKHISRALTLNGFGVMRFDFTGLGESEGDFEDTNFTSNVADLLAASEYLKKEYMAPAVIVGHSLGGAAALFAAKQMNHIKAVVTIGAPSYPEHVTHLLKDKKEEIEKNGCARVSIGGREFTIKKQFLDDLQGQEHIPVIKNLGKALLVMHSPQDKIVGIENAANIYKLAKHPKSYITLDGADHMLTNKEDAHYAGNVIASWVKRYIEFPKIEKLATDKQVVVRLEGDDYTTEIQADEHSLIADEPISFGGNDFGMSPYELLNASLGACTAMTLKMYARRKKWPLEDVLVHLSYSKTQKYEEHKSSPEKSTSRIDRFERELELVGELSQDQKRRLLEIANKCPVHRTIASPSEFATKLIEDEEWEVHRFD
ncbi:MAG: bifunctional alpha/beta hydrolase/OsmC family protein, partial [Saprospiraceae bacterium]|nr:bifunctional alpha/beta hydrolase/OsmC family protein [Saprospiraceae bacterium]